MELQFFNTSKIKLERKPKKIGEHDWLQLSITDAGQEHVIDLFAIEAGKPLEIEEG